MKMNTALTLALLLSTACALPGQETLAVEQDVDQDKAAASILFPADYAAPQSLNLAPGAQVRIQYPTARMQRVLNDSSGTGYYLASAHHCYGYGCCEVEFPDLRVQVRFDGGRFQTVEVDAAGTGTFTIPTGAHRLELYVESPSYDLKSWYCGSEESRSQSTWRNYQRQVYDSQFGRNFHFAF